MSLIIIGAGRHAHMVIALAEEANAIPVLGVVAPDGQTVYGYPNLGDDSVLPQYAGHPFVVAIGDNAARAQVYAQACAAGLNPCPALVHPAAVVMRGVTLGAGTVVMPGVTLEVDAVIGANVILNTNASVGHNAVIGDHVHVCPGVNVNGNAAVGEGALIGTNAALTPGSQVGNWAKVGAGSIVIKPVPDGKKRIPRSKKRPVHLVVYAPIIGRGGVHRLVERLTAQLADNPDFKITALSNAISEHGQAVRWDERIELVPLNGTPPAHPRLFAWAEGMQEEGLRMLRALEPSVVWLPQPWWTMRREWGDTDFPVVASIHDFAFDYLNMTGLQPGFRSEARQMAQRNALTLFTSEWQRDWGLRNYEFPPERTRVVHFAEFLPSTYNPTPEEGARVRAKYGLPERFTLAFHCATKNPEVLIGAHALARGQLPPLVIAGLETEYLRPDARHLIGESARQRQQGAGLVYGRDLFVLGAVPDEDIAGLYAACSVSVTATSSEGGVGAVVYETFAARKPLVYTDIPVHLERLGKGDYGYPFAVGSDFECARALKAVYADYPAAQQKALKGSAFMLKRTWADVAQDYADAFMEVL